ncbi:hypothetical protein ACQ33O_11930 [Ferruginibacter sp. SUN002]|uniref:hypothetical protein n=1 Tax=Ferruginibacter sp. SUN002 TaxID=2937789 RepID=UPI003D35C1DE
MNRKFCFVAFSILFLLQLPALSQGIRNPEVAANESRYSVNYGLRLGYVYKSKISGLGSTILSEPFFFNYTMQEVPKNGWAGSAYVSFRRLEALALHAEIGYAQQGAMLKYRTTEESGKDFYYDMDFNYQYININGMIKIYPLTAIKPKDENVFYGFYVGGGPQVGLNVAPQNIVYKSGGKDRLPAFGSDLEQQQQIRNVLKGKTNFGFNVVVGHEFRNSGLSLEARYFIGLTDVVETQPNSYNFIENKNVNKAFQFTLGWDFSIYNKAY